MIDHDQTLRIFGYIFHAMRNQHNGNPTDFVKFCDLIKDLISSLRIKTCGRLIQNQDLWVHCKYTCNGHSLLLTTEKFKW